MDLRIKPYPKNIYPFGGLLIKDGSLSFWMKTLHDIQLRLEDVSIYPIPGNIANTIWGCLVRTNKPVDPHIAGKHELCQQVSENLFIPERAMLDPQMTNAELLNLFNTGMYIMHPEFGLVELPDALDLKMFIAEPLQHSYYVTRPGAAIFVPKQIKSFQVKPIAPEDLLENLEKKIFPQKETMKDDSLSLLEKGRLLFYKLLFTTNKKEKIGSDGRTKKSGLWAKTEEFFNAFSNKESAIGQKMQQDFEDLERRNQKEVDKLLDLLKNNPMEALKYAIPIDSQGSTRGGNNSSFTFSKRWLDFSLFNSANRGAGIGSVDLGESVNLLRDQYTATAQQLIKDKEFHKAAFIYMKLLQNYYMAAQTLEQGEYYQEAALIYLNSHNKSKAAECYEKGKMTEEAIVIYKELNQNEKVGDLYVTLNKKKHADVYFEKVVGDYKNKSQFVKASLIYRNKMHNRQAGQSMLLEGWKSNKDALNCLNNYFSNIEDIKALKVEIAAIHQTELGSNSDLFLQAIQHPYKRHRELSEWIREIAYEVISSQTTSNPNIVTEMKLFNQDDKYLLKDTFRFRLRKKT